MNVVNLNFYAKGYYSEAEHEENILISEEFFKKIESKVKETEYYVCDLDGKFSEVKAELEVQEFSEEDVRDWAEEDVVCDYSETCWYKIDSICSELGLNLEAECDRVVEWCKSVAKKGITVKYVIPQSKLEELNAFVAKLCEEGK